MYTLVCASSAIMRSPAAHSEPASESRSGQATALPTRHQPLPLVAAALSPSHYAAPLLLDWKASPELRRGSGRMYFAGHLHPLHSGRKSSRVSPMAQFLLFESASSKH